ncbi:hypothetical protein C7Y58_09695 [Fusobacterium nucleatum subsp. nucleatum ATCC 25586]|uniref:Uncharacterized protein n=2 Tax=Fusobacterium nucleatum subsp. nucleatum TaxID=76856 RepID=Q8RE01_FUSNN|nr:hypothetical protein [Fusobacterium nucleatum]AAL95533.1 unknown [Fusobacterium nucleatum subsp. nucleatum ATCC 25586]ALF24767.1 hypothetical protein RO05_10465 [Fusobacterium nucleatum subsp. nucleatum ChDC F316]ASG25993.1 hypothetical protein RN84_03410 [Fusobacterium nucleatum subsp. nucleatum]AVQ15648.1 hypothetical protein C7Y58_09695 [Fusobacterium nucleatum subsp. nucleatum ATCC 25586]WMS28679.1 hypothetical protein RDV57_05905 [Fusobacterium nucleatum]
MEIINFLERKGWLVNKKIKSNKYFVEVPKFLSFIENTDETIDFFKNFLFSYKIIHKKPVFISWELCEDIDLSAATLFTLMFLIFGINCEEEGKRKKDVLGTNPKKENINALLWGNSLFRHICGKDEEIVNYDLGIEPFNLIAGGKSEVELIKIFKLGINGDILLDPLKDNCTYISNYISNSQKEKGKILSPFGYNCINSLVGEILTNSKEHLGNEYSQYFITGFFKKDIGEINLSFINFGDTFYHGIKYNSKDIKETLNEMIKTYKMQNGEFSEDFTEEMFCTLYALQFKISREYEKNGEIRGTGMKAVFDFFFSLKEKEKINPTFTLISGNTKIQFDINDKKYYNKGILIFNDNNNFFKEQVRKNIFKLKNFFPGTIISLNFGIEDSWLKEIEKND